MPLTVDTPSQRAADWRMRRGRTAILWSTVQAPQTGGVIDDPDLGTWGGTQHHLTSDVVDELAGFDVVDTVAAVRNIAGVHDAGYVESRRFGPQVTVVVKDRPGNTFRGDLVGEAWLYLIDGVDWADPIETLYGRRCEEWHIVTLGPVTRWGSGGGARAALTAAVVTEPALDLTVGPPPFDVEAEVPWHSLFWAESPAMLAAYDDTDTVTDWFNSTAESDATGGTANTLFVESDPDLNDRPAVRAVYNQVQALAQTFAVSPTYPVTLIAVAADVRTGGNTSDRRLVDGLDNDNRAAVGVQGTLALFIAAGTNRSSGVGTMPAGLHGLVATFDGGAGVDVGAVDGVTLITADAGPDQAAGLRLLSAHTGGSAWDGPVGLIGIVETADPRGEAWWPTFAAWVDRHYGTAI